MTDRSESPSPTPSPRGSATAGTATDRRVASIPIHSEADIVAARQQGRTMGAELGFAGADLTIIATAISELARNIVLYAKEGEITLSKIENGRRPGIGVVSRDRGPGIPDVAEAMRDGFSTSGGLGVGLPGVKRLMDEFEIASAVGGGTTVTIKKWKR